MTNMSMDKQHPNLRVTFIGKESRDATLKELGSFLSDLSTLYEEIRLAIDENYNEFEFNRSSQYMSRVALNFEDNLFVEKIRKESPIELAVVIGTGTIASIGAVWTLVQVVEKIYNIGLNRRKLELEVRKAELEVNKLETEAGGGIREPLTVENLMRRLKTRDPIGYISVVEGRLSKSTIQIENVHFELVERTNKATKRDDERE